MSGANLASGIGLPSPVSSSRPSTLIELRGITKAFPGVVANDCIDLTLRGGEIHCLLGENGAGKSTLIGILSGLIRPDAGRIAIDGVETAITSPRRALELGIGTVHQHSTLIPALTVLENLMLGDSRTLRLNERAARSRLADLSAQLSVEIDPDARVADLALGHQQQVEIVKALWRGSRLLILDEPTSMLTPKLHEALTLGDQISILRQGRLVGEITPEEIRTQSQAELRAEIIRIMFGEEARSVAGVAELREELTSAPTARRTDSGDVVLELRKLTVRGAGSERGVDDISFQLHEGEILGIAGIDGHGQRALAEAI